MITKHRFHLNRPVDRQTLTY